MASVTANYGWTKPAVGADDDVWGGEINTDLDGIDATVKSVSNVANAAYPAANPAGYQTAAQVTAALTPYYLVTNPAGYQTAAQVNTTLVPYALTASVPVGSSTVPAMDGTAAVGTGTTYARTDHIHPSDTSKLSLTGGTLTGALNGTTASFSGTISAGGAVTAAGATLSGALTITKPFVNPGDDAIKISPSSGSASFVMSKTAGSFANNIWGQNGTTPRWLMQLGNTAAETGSNIGSDFWVIRYDDTGALIDVPFQIARVSGQAYFNSIVNTKTTVNIQSDTTPGLWLQNGAGSTNMAGFYFDMSVGNAALYQVFSGGVAYINNTGNLTISGNGFKPGGGAWAATSDIRIKTIKGDYKQGLEAILKLRPVSYVYKGNDAPPALVRKEDDTTPVLKYGTTQAAEAGTVFIGLVAQEVETAMPELVSKGEGWIDGKAVTDLRNLDSSPLVYALINAVKELEARIAILEATP